MIINSPLTDGGTGVYKMYYESLPGTSNDYGESGAVTCSRSVTSDPITSGTISSGSITFTYDYDGTLQEVITVSVDTL